VSAVSQLRASTAWPPAGVPGALRELVAKDLKLKYKRSVLGFLWSLLTPLALMGVYLFVFGRVFDAPQTDFGLFLICGLVPWHFFTLAVTGATNSLLVEGQLIGRINFPRLLVPVSTVAANMAHFMVALACLVVAVSVAGRAPWVGAHWLVLAVVLETALCLGLGLALSVWNVRLRDIGQLISIFAVLLFFATPVVYELSQVPEGYRPLVLANPLTMIMEAYRAALFEGPRPDLGPMLLSIGETALVLALGWWAFSRRAPELAKDL
jgi:ABC-2 type transport system permease protein